MAGELPLQKESVIPSSQSGAGSRGAARGDVSPKDESGENGVARSAADSDVASPGLCAKCSAAGGSCCRGTEVFVTAGDLRRIGAVAGHDLFYEHVPAGEAPDGDAAWARIFTSPRGRRILAHLRGGNCVFLAANGCRLDMETRPLVCRLYPFEYDDTCIKGVSAHYCPLPERENAPLILALLDMDRDRAEEWRRILYGEIAEEFGS